MTTVYLAGIVAVAVVVLVVVVLYRRRLSSLELTSPKFRATLIAGAASPEAGTPPNRSDRGNWISIVRSTVRRVLFEGRQAPTVKIHRSDVRDLSWSFKESKDDSDIERNGLPKTRTAKDIER